MLHSSWFLVLVHAAISSEAFSLVSAACVYVRSSDSPRDLTGTGVGQAQSSHGLAKRRNTTPQPIRFERSKNSRVASAALAPHKNCGSF